jgi:hypothetical protein
MERREQEFNVASKELRYKTTAQYVEAITRQFPEFIRKRMTTSKTPLSYKRAKGMVAALY